MSELTSRIGIVAIGRNEGERLKRCLASITSGMPVVYVDSNSTDGSTVFARGTGAIVVDLDLTRPFTAARARKEGFEALIRAHPAIEFVQFVDGDCEFEAGWIEQAAAFLDTQPDVAVVCGRRRERFPGASYFNHLCDLEWNTPVGEAMACGGDSLMRVSSYLSVGGFDPTMVAGEEPELCRRVRATGGRIWRIDAPMTIHDAAMLHFRQWWNRAVRGGFGYAQAWHVGRLYQAELLRAVMWGGLLPLLAIILSFAVSPVWLLLLILPIMQTGRLAMRGGDWTLRRAALLSLSKFAEFKGVLGYVRQLGSKRVEAPKSYK